VDDNGEKRAALEAVVEHVALGRSRDARSPTDEELEATLVLALQIDEASAKARTGPPKDCVAIPSYVREYWRPSADSAHGGRSE
jgi:nitroimidazol reductase NimA-like FMN-containing flavoprotein (pyridoxamine 5'-phosphate oxidase superfamily)